MSNDTRDRMQDAASAIEAYLPPGSGFILLAFDLNSSKGHMEYVSNGKREDCLAAMQEFIKNNKERGIWGTHQKGI